MFKVETGGAPPRAPARLQNANSASTTTTTNANPSPSPWGRDGFDAAPRRTVANDAALLGQRSGGGGGKLTPEERTQKLQEIRASLGGDLDSAQAGEALQNLRPEDLKGLELGLVASKGDRVVYVDGQGKIADVRVTAANAKGVIDQVKAADQELRTGSYDLRKAVVERSGGKVSTADGYTYLPDQPLAGDALKEWRTNTANWVPERVEVQKAIFDEGLGKAEALSNLAGKETEKNVIYALRGNTAAGKSTAVKTHEQFGKLAAALDGAINPDTYKFELRQADASGGRMNTASRQVHEEGSVIASRIEKEMLKQGGSSLVFDKRFHEARDIPDLIQKARDNGKTVKIIDIDAPLQLSAARVLGRNANKDAPLVPFEAVADGFRGIRRNRLDMLSEIVSDPLVKDYAMYVADDQGTSHLVAYKKDGEWHGPDTPEKADLYRRATSLDVSADVEKARHQKIDDAFIERMVAAAPEKFRPEVRASLEDFRGKTLEQALDAKATQVNDPKLGYVQKAEENLQATSRTANGTVDTSASADKADKMQASGQEAAEKAAANFDGVMKGLYDDRHKTFESPKELRQFVEAQATAINDGITKPGVLIREGADSARYPYTKVADLPKAMNQFYDELFRRLNNPKQDPRQLAAWIEYRMDLTDHFFADGCGKAAKAISAWALMRAGQQLPTYGSRDAYYDLGRPEGSRVPTQARDLYRWTEADPQFARWYSKYLEFFPGGKVG